MSEIRVWKIVPLSMVTTSEQERDKWIAAGHEVVEFVSIDRITQLETELAEARKDQARLDFITYHGISMRIDQTRKPNTWYMDAIYHTNIDLVDGRTRFKTSREAIDAAIKEQGK